MSTHLRNAQLSAQRDEALAADISRVWHDNRCVYGARKVWKQLNRESMTVARCTVERLMGVLELQGVRRGKRCKTTIPDEAANQPLEPPRVYRRLFCLSQATLLDSVLSLIHI